MLRSHVFYQTRAHGVKRSATQFRYDIISAWKAIAIFGKAQHKSAARKRAIWLVLCLSAFAAAGDTFTNDLEYLKRKWRTNVTDEGTGLVTADVLAGWREIVAARGDEPWETTKAKIFAFGCDRTAIGVSPHDWFPAFAPWSFHRGHPLWKILPQRANEVDARRSPGLAKKIDAALGHDIAHHFARQANNIPNSRGGRFVAGGHSSRRFIDFGKRMGATPDGRKKGEEMSKNLSPAPGSPPSTPPTCRWTCRST